MNDALEERNRKVIMDSKTIIYLRFVDNIDSLAEEENNLENLMKSLDTLHKVENGDKCFKDQTYGKALKGNQSKII